MTLSIAARRGLAFALSSDKAAAEIVTMINGGAGGTLSVDTRRRLEIAFVDRQTAAEMVTLVQSASSAASPNLSNRMGIMLGARHLANEIVLATA